MTLVVDFYFNKSNVIKKGRLMISTFFIFFLSCSYDSKIKINPKNIRVFGGHVGMLPEDNSISRVDDLQELAIYFKGDDDDPWFS